MATITKRPRKGGLSWGVRVRVNGNPTLTRSFPTKLEAERWASLTEAAVKQRPMAVVTKATLGDLLDEFQPHAKPSTKLLLGYWRRELGDMLLRNIPPP